MKGLLLTLVIAMISIQLSMGKTDTRRKHQPTAPEAVERLSALNGHDSLHYADKIILSGYGKNITDANETFYVTNDTPFLIARLQLKFTYTTTGGEMIHEEIYDIPCEIPPSETRQVSVRSFDRQHNLYYYRNRKPKRAATPYKISYTVVAYDARIYTAE